MSSSVAEIQEARAQSASLSREALTVDLVDGRTIIVPLTWFPRLWHGTQQERNHFEVFGDGAYIHWPDLDEDLTVAGLSKHGMSFEEALTIFADPLARIFDDEDHSVDELRKIAIGHSATACLLVVCFSAGEHTVRIFSARRATKRERQDYEENVRS